MQWNALKITKKNKNLATLLYACVPYIIAVCFSVSLSVSLSDKCRANCKKIKTKQIKREFNLREKQIKFVLLLLQFAELQAI